MLEQISPLWNVFTEKQQQGEPLVLATLVSTTGSSYKKSGAMMLIEADKTSHGLLSGGCLEADVVEHAMCVFEDQQAISLNYDMSDESIFGLGAGCDGTLQVVLQLISGDYLPFSALNPSPDQAMTTSLYINSGIHNDFSIGDFWLNKQQKTVESTPGFYQAVDSESESMLYSPPPKVVICGAGIDVSPLLEMLHILQWHVYLVDHRPGRLKVELHPKNTHLLSSDDMPDLSQANNHDIDAVIIMTHNIDRDANYLKHFYQTDCRWIGLLGPPKRRDKVLNKADISLPEIEHRLHAPIGLNIGGHMPENIAVSIVAELQQYFNKS